MASSLGSLVVRLGLDSAEYTNALNRAEAQAARFAATTERSMQSANRAATQTANAAKYVGQAFAALSAAFGVRELVRLADEYQNVNGRLAIFANSTQELAQLQKQLFAVANNSRQSLGATSDLYYQLANATQDVGTSQKDLLRITEAVNKGLLVSGSSGSSARGVIIQLSQALAAGKLRGQEFNTINEQGNRILRALAEGLGITVDKLRDMANNGEITTAVFVRGFSRGMKGIEEDFKKLPVTISGALQIMENELQRFVGTEFQTVGKTNLLAEAILLAAKNIDILTAAALGFGVTKIANLIGEIAERTINNTKATLQDIAATRARNTVVAAGAEFEIQRLRAVEASIVATRAQVASTLQLTNSYISAGIASKTANAQQLADLARLSAAQTANNVLLAEQQLLLGKATGSAGIWSRALGLVGGALGAVTLALGIGVAAWQAWSSRATRAAEDAADSMERSTEDIIAALEKQIKKIEERNKIRQEPQQLIKDKSDSELKAEELLKQAALLRAVPRAPDVNPEFGLTNIEEEKARELEAQAARLLVNLGKLDRAKNIEVKLNQADTAKRLMTELATDAEKLAEALKDLETSVGKDNPLFPELKKRLEEKYKPKVVKPPAGSDDSKQVLTGQLRAIEAQIAREKDILNAQEAFLKDYYQEGYLSVAQYYDRIDQARTENLQKLIDAYNTEIAATENLRDKATKATDRQDAQNKIDDLRARILNANRDAGFAEQALARERSKSNQEYIDQLNEINAKILEMNGNTAEATRIRVDQQTRTQLRFLESSGQPFAAEQQRAINQQAVVQAQLNDVTKKYSIELGYLQIAQEQVNIARDSGAITELDSLYKLSDVNKSRLEQLRAIADEMYRIAQLSKDPAAALAARQAQVSIERLATQTDLVADKFNKLFSDTLADGLVDVVTGAKSVKEAFNDMARSISQAITRIAANNLAEALFGKTGPASGAGSFFSRLFGGNGGPAGGDIFGWLTKLFGFGGGGIPGTGGFVPGPQFGEFASGTSHAKGGMAWVGERGRELVRLPKGSEVIPNHELRHIGRRPGTFSPTMNFNVNVMPGADTRSAKQAAGLLRDAVLKSIKDK